MVDPKAPDPAEAADPVTAAIRRALDAAEAANFAAEDIARISAAHQRFASDVARGQRRSAALAGGAAAGAVLALVLSGLVWLRSTADLREASEVTATAAELLVEQVTRFDKLMDGAEARDAKIAGELQAMTDQVGSDLAKLGRSQSPMQAQTADAIRQGVKADLEALKAELMQALAAQPAASGDSAEVKALLEEMQSLAAEMAAQHAPVVAKPAKPAVKPSPKPAAKAKPEPDPFVYP